MKVVILAGGLGTRLAEETAMRPKPMVEIGGRPLLWHIMSIYAGHGLAEFVVACGYKQEMIKQYFHDFFLTNSDCMINLRDGSFEVIQPSGYDWRIAVIDTGMDTMTGGRVLRSRPFVGEGAFAVTYGDGVGDIDITALIAFHRSHGRWATVTAVRPPSRFGGLVIEGDQVRDFSEKPQTGEGWINGGFFVFEPQVFEYLKGDRSILERETLERLAEEGQLMAFKHDGFWQPMDTLREKQNLEQLWATGDAPWMPKP